MSNLSIKNVQNAGVNGTNEVSFKGKSVSADNKPSKDEGMKKSTKLMIGATALAVTIAGGLLTRHIISANSLKKIAKEAEEGKRWIEGMLKSNAKDENYTRFFDPEITKSYIEEADKLAPKERLEKLNEIRCCINNDRNLADDLIYEVVGEGAEGFRNSLPKNVQEAINKKDHVAASKAYQEYCDNLFAQSTTAGKTIEESVAKRFGENSGVKPHTYDLDKEVGNISVVYSEGAGYVDRTVTKNNIIPNVLNEKHNLSGHKYTGNPMNGCMGECYENAFDSHITLSEGIATDGKQYVSIGFRNILPPSNRDFTAINNRKIKRSGHISLVSDKEGTLTQAQQDLLSLKDKELTEQEINLFKQAMDNHEGLNYDAFLSLIQTIAHK